MALAFEYANQNAITTRGMAMGDIDKISMLLGQIRSDIKTLFNSLTQHKIATSNQTESLRAELKSEISRVIKMIEDGDAPLKEATNDYEKNKYKIIGAGLMAAIFGGFFGSKIQFALAAIGSMIKGN